MSNYKYLIISDLDGTLCNRTGFVSKQTIEYVHQLNKRDDVLLTFSTGRAWEDAKEVYEALQLKSFASCLNGAYIYDPHTKKELCFFLSQKFGRMLLTSPRINDGLQKGVILTNKTSIKFESQNALQCLKILEETGDDIIGIKLFYKEDHDNVIDILQTIKNFRPRPTISVFKDHGLIDIEIQASHVSKETTVIYLSNYFGVDHKNVLTFGDNHNDLPAMSGCSRSYAVNNAIWEVKQQAKFLSKFSNNEDSVIKEVDIFLKKNNINV